MSCTIFNSCNSQPFYKTPAEVEDYTFDWSCDLGTDTIEPDGSSWAVTDPSLTISNQSIGNPADTTTVWLSGGTLGMQYIITNTVTTVGGRTFQRSFALIIRQYNPA